MFDPFGNPIQRESKWRLLFCVMEFAVDGSDILPIAMYWMLHSISQIKNAPVLFCFVLFGNISKPREKEKCMDLWREKKCGTQCPGPGMCGCPVNLGWMNAPETGSRAALGGQSRVPGEQVHWRSTRLCLMSKHDKSFTNHIRFLFIKHAINMPGRLLRKSYVTFE